jgi:hypothetical protein
MTHQDLFEEKWASEPGAMIRIIDMVRLDRGNRKSNRRHETPSRSEGQRRTGLAAGQGGIGEGAGGIDLRGEVAYQAGLSEEPMVSAAAAPAA